MYITRTFDCADCGARTTRKRESHQPRICKDCGIMRAANAAREMANKRGPAWDSFMLSPGRHGARAHRS